MQKLTEIITQLTQGRWQMTSAQTIDKLQAEKERLEKSLASPPLLHRTSSSKVKLAELQKFIDMAG